MTKVLIVDDSKYIRAMLQGTLKSQGYELVVAENGKQALEMARSCQPDVILLDVVMPVMDGMEACRLLREDPCINSIYVIMLTAKNEVKDRVDGLDIGADDYLPKPFEIEELFARIRRGHKIVKERRAAMFDLLTGLYNRRSFEDFFERESAKAKRQKQPITLIMLDIDYFKKVNDTWGHAAGDVVLVELAAILRKSLRISDLPCRWGGEEFLLLLPDMDLANGLKKAEAIRRVVEEHDFPEAGQLTASLGVAVTEDGDDLLSLQERADKALYAAKDGGRNQVVSQ